MEATATKKESGFKSTMKKAGAKTKAYVGKKAEQVKEHRRQVKSDKNTAMMSALSAVGRKRTISRNAPPQDRQRHRALRKALSTATVQISTRSPAKRNLNNKEESTL